VISFSGITSTISDGRIKGTSSFGGTEIVLPAQAIYVSQILWGSIGWTVGSTLGAALAAREQELGRTCLFVGDGSL